MSEPVIESDHAALMHLLGPILLDELKLFEQARIDVDEYELRDDIPDARASVNRRRALESARDSYGATTAFLLLRRWQRARDEAPALQGP